MIRIRAIIFCGAGAAILFGLAFARTVSIEAADDAVSEVELGRRLFEEERFSNPQGDMRTSCASCHPRSGPQGYRGFTEYLARSWHPWRNEDPGRDTLRNTPTVLGSADATALHFDGEFSSLEELVESTLLGRNMGWLAGERDAALGRLQEVTKSRAGDAYYARAFLSVYEADVDSLTREALLDFARRAIAGYIRALPLPEDTPYDVFVKANGLDDGPARGESARAFAQRLTTRIEDLDSGDHVQFPVGFGPDALEGWKIFFRTSGSSNVGNCVACHVPPAFTDFSFHNTGVSQSEYDA